MTMAATSLSSPIVPANPGARACAVTRTAGWRVARGSEIAGERCALWSADVRIRSMFERMALRTSRRLKREEIGTVGRSRTKYGRENTLRAIALTRTPNAHQGDTNVPAVQTSTSVESANGTRHKR